MHHRLVLLPIVATALLPRAAAANDRHMTYTYESAVLAEGARELEVWTTARVGRHGYYAAFDQRLEFETGLTNRLQTSFYLNFSGITAETGGVKSSQMEFGGVSSEWK